MASNNATERVVCWFSCGVTSAVAAKLAVRDYAGKPLEVVYCDTGGEHPSNVAFLGAVQEWIDHPITLTIFTSLVLAKRNLTERNKVLEHELSERVILLTKELYSIFFGVT